jgi:L-alanine-DL-glutamate epimerase-like enolase superfamily enzyme
MQIGKVEVTPVELKLRHPVCLAGLSPISDVTAVFLRIETRDGKNAWGCTVAHPDFTDEKPDDLIRICQAGADKALDLHPTNIEYTLSELAPVVEKSPAALCAFDLAFHDLLGLAAGMPLYRLLGGYRNRIQTSITIPLSSLQESVELACKHARSGFRMLKIKGGLNPSEDVELVRAIRRSLPDHVLRLDADGGYSVEQALDVTRALKNDLEMLEQPTPAGDLEGLRQVTLNSPIPVLADQSLSSPYSALKLAAPRSVNGLSVKMVTCGGLRCARQVDAIARAARISTMVSCLVEPALLIAAGLSFALSSPNVLYGDLDGHLDLVDDPTIAGFRLEEGWLVASDVPGLGCTVQLD